jgi:glycopeptide antibiotics resistance protein
VLLVGAVLAALAVTMVGSVGGIGVNLVPGAGIRGELDNVNHGLGMLNVLGNMVMFVPIGFLLPLALFWRWQKSSVSCVALSVVMEVAQLAVGRSADIDDVLLNAVGGALGAALGVCAAPLLRNSSGLACELSTSDSGGSDVHP